MRFVLVISLLFISQNLFSQANITTGRSDNEDFTYSCAGSSKILEFFVAEWEDEIDISPCDIKYDEQGSDCLKILISGSAPWDTDKNKLKSQGKLDRYFQILKNSFFSLCAPKNIGGLIIQLSDGLFVFKKDGGKNKKKYYSKSLNDKLTALNLERFVQKYQTFFDKYFNGKPVTIVNWAW